MVKDGEEAEVLNIFFVSVFSNKIVCSLYTQPPKMEHKDKEQTKSL